MRRTLLGSLLAVGFVCGLFFIRPWPRLHAADAAAGANALAAARHLFLTGNEAEAIDALTPLAERDPAAALLLARATLAHGQANAETAADEQLQAAAKRFPKAGVFPAERARLAFARGDLDLARAQVAEALRIEPDELMAHWIDAELDRVVGKLPDAEKKYRWFVDYYNAHEEKSPDALRIIGWGAAQFARWKRLQDQFIFLVNDLYPDCLKLEADYWPAHYESGCLFLEKYNQAEASKEFKAALAINPNAAVVYAAQAELALQSYDLAEAKTNLDRALKLNPDLNRAYLLQARLHLANFAADEAIQVLERARQRASFNKLDEEPLGTLAAAYAAVDGQPEHLAGSRAGKLAAEVDARNPHAGVFYFALASGLDAVRKFPAAAQFYEEASRRMPQLLGPKSELGLMWMRLGKEVEAEQVLKAAFDEDPFNIRV
ncbi:MAG TPA: tetratricopeptide repeat protein, partial [Pirellulales bacterium]|nr:tetratricopeptide repeat protein [Pirellulales bacterium]